MTQRRIGLMKRKRPLRRCSGGLDRIRQAPMATDRLALPCRALFVCSLIANRKDKIEIRAFPGLDFRDMFGPQRRNLMPVLLQQRPRIRVDLAAWSRARRTGLKPAAAHLAVTSGTLKGTTVPLGASPILIGRAATCTGGEQAGRAASPRHRTAHTTKAKLKFLAGAPLH